MNYKKIYDSIINRAINRKTLDKPYDKHHILPASMGGSNNKSNIVKLTLREHFICHMLLAKIYGKSMLHAFWMLSSFRKYNSKKYECLRTHYIKECLLGDNNPSRRFPKTEEQKEHFRKTSLERKWVNNGVDSCMAKDEKLQELLSSGWEYGRLITKSLTDGLKLGGEKSGGKNKGKKMSEQQKSKLKIAFKNRTNKQDYINPIAKKWKIISPDGKIYVTFGLITFCRNNNLGCSTSLINAGKGNSTVKKGKSRGWSAYEIKE
jgi:hypothetical protein